MLESIFILLLVTAIILLVLSITWESLALCITDIVLWLILAISVFNIEIPYQAIDSSDDIVTGVHTVESLYYLNWLFLGIALIMMLYLLSCIVFPMLQGKFGKVM